MSKAGTPDFFYREAQRLGYVARSAFKLLQIQEKYKLIKPGSSVLDLGCAWLQVACQCLGPIKNGGAVVGFDLKKVKVPSTHCDARVQTFSADVMNLPRKDIRALSSQVFMREVYDFKESLPEFLVLNRNEPSQLQCYNLVPEIPSGKYFLSINKKKGFSVILSDMCPPVSGITTKDAALSVELGMRALDLAVGRAALGNPDHDNTSDGLSDGSTSGVDDDGLLQPKGHLLIKLLESEDIQEFNRICKPLFRKASWLRPKATRSSSREIYLICQGLQL